jgi:GNAT superfamily N-acetyltransferase
MTDQPRLTPTLRPAGPADVRAIAEFQTRAWRTTYRGLVPQDYLDRMDADVREARWGRRLRTVSRRIALAETDGAVLGVVSWGRAPAEDGLPALELKSLYVDPARHGTGLAATLLEFAIGGADAQLWCYEANPRARAFYAKHGFHPDGTVGVDPDTGVREIRLVRRR